MVTLPPEPMMTLVTLGELRCDMAFIVPMHRNKPDITSLLTSGESSSEIWIKIKISISVSRYVSEYYRGMNISQSMGNL